MTKPFVAYLSSDSKKVILDSADAQDVFDYLGNNLTDKSPSNSEKKVIIIIHESGDNALGDFTDTSSPHIHLLKNWTLNEDDDYGILQTEGLRHARYLDSSIWHYCFHTPKGDNIVNYNDHTAQTRQSIEEEFQKILSEISQNYAKHLYELAVAAEFVDLNNRLSKECDLLRPIAHPDVVPFLFHSENDSRKRLEAEIKLHGFAYGKKWRLLLVDDHAGTSLTHRDGEDQESGVSKMDILVWRITSMGIKVRYQISPGKSEPEDSVDWDMEIDYVTSTDELEKALWDSDSKKKRYDIILLDYLLKTPKTVDYSYKFIEELKVKVENNPDGKILAGIGPKHRLYFMFVSSFVTAIQERLDILQVHRSEKYWHIGRGACVINTPYLFLCNLHAIMGKRLETILGSGRSDLKDAYASILKQSLVDGKNGKKNLQQVFPELLELTEVDDIIKNDCDMDKYEPSLLLSSIQKANEKILTISAELRHLFYLMAYGANWQWPEMWQLFERVQACLDEDTQNRIKAYIVNRYNGK